MQYPLVEQTAFSVIIGIPFVVRWQLRITLRGCKLKPTIPMPLSVIICFEGASGVSQCLRGHAVATLL